MFSPESDKSFRFTRIINIPFQFELEKDKLIVFQSMRTDSKGDYILSEDVI